MFQDDRHESLISTPWDEAMAHGAMHEIASSALSHFDAGKLWPAHPLDSVPDGLANIYLGATGVILALDMLKRDGAIDHLPDFAALMPGIAERDNAWLKNMPMGAYGSLLFGDLGTHLVHFRLRAQTHTADRIIARASDNNALPPLELMWGTAGSMLACVFMHEMTGEDRFEILFRRQAVKLLDDLDAAPPRLWTQELYGKRARYLGLVHGFAGNLFALIRGWNWLTPDQQSMIGAFAMHTLLATAIRGGLRANWPANADASDEPLLCQICHGAPGILAAFGEAPFSSPEFERLLVEAGHLVWAAGPLKKGSNFCHGTGGNAYALLKLYKRTGDAIWLEHAQAFAMHAIAQMRVATQVYGRGRYSLWTGDPGLAVCLSNCIKGEPRFPGLDAL